MTEAKRGRALEVGYLDGIVDQMTDASLPPTAAEAARRELATAVWILATSGDDAEMLEAVRSLEVGRNARRHRVGHDDAASGALETFSMLLGVARQDLFERGISDSMTSEGLLDLVRLLDGPGIGEADIMSSLGVGRADMETMLGKLRVVEALYAVRGMSSPTWALTQVGRRAAERAAEREVLEPVSGMSSGRA